ncbi:unnamed protein product [Gulo gulo]|uniref:Uncharacterized protein n=1 Tax=Gulo gulo TaxID=48420 RepID=A0A9X9Q4C0_GULGU|nr:unnamed protein product [Gulo gulo]
MFLADVSRSCPGALYKAGGGPGTDPRFPAVPSAHPRDGDWSPIPQHADTLRQPGRRHHEAGGTRGAAGGAATPGTAAPREQPVDPGGGGGRSPGPESALEPRGAKPGRRGPRAALATGGALPAPLGAGPVGIPDCGGAAETGRPSAVH